MTNDDYVKGLKVVGLSDKEAQVYLALLELGPSKIRPISTHSGVKRPTCYILLDSLTKKGIAKIHDSGETAVYSVITPRELALLEHKGHNNFINILPQLEGMASKAAGKPKVSYFEGEIGIMEVYNLTLEMPKESVILTYGTVPIKTKYNDFIDQYHKVRANKGIKNLSIYPDTPENRQIALRDPLEARMTRFLPAEKFNQKTEVLIFGDTIAYVSHSDNEPIASIVENPLLTQEERQRFGLLWETSVEQ